MKLTIGRRISAGFLLVIVLVAAMSTFTYFEVGILNSSYQKMMSINMQKIELAQGIAVDIANEAVAMRRFNFTGDPADTQAYSAYRKQADEKLKQLESILKTDAARLVTAEIKQEKSVYEAIVEKSFAAKQANDTAQVGAYMQQAGKPYIRAMDTAQKLVTLVTENVKMDEAAGNQQATQMQYMLLLVNILVAVLAVCISTFISRSLARRMKLLQGELLAVSELDLTQKGCAC